jgi:hypothetical protein
MTNGKKMNWSAIGLACITLVLITLKLCKIIKWSWWIVTAPAWVPIALLVLSIIFYMIGFVLEDYERNRLRDKHGK